MIMLPLLATALFLNVAFKAGLALVRPFLSLNSKKEEQLHLDSGYNVQETDRKPRSERKYDVVVLGATGFAGKLVVRYLAKTYGIGKQVRWAIAGRSQKKLDEVKKEIAKDLGCDELNSLDTIVCDVLTPSTLPKLVYDTRVVVSTAGPYTLYGKHVVEFCAKFGTHYADISGEPGWLLTMMEKWEETARRTGAKLITYCGATAIPSDLTVMKLEQMLKSRGDEDLVNVTCYDDIVADLTGGSFQTLCVEIRGQSMSLPNVDPFYDKAKNRPQVNSKFASFPFKTTLPWNGKTAYASPFGLADNNVRVIGWSHALRSTSSTPLIYNEFSINPDFKTAFLDWFTWPFLISLLLNPVFGCLVQRALPKPGSGPSMENMTKKYYLIVHAYGIGSKGSETEAVMYFPHCPAYLETARMLAESGLSLALDEGKLPKKVGGFFTPAVGLWRRGAGPIDPNGHLFCLSNETRCMIMTLSKAFANLIMIVYKTGTTQCVASVESVSG